MCKKELSHLFGILLGLIFFLSGIKGIYVKEIYNLIFIVLGIFLVFLNIYILLERKK